MPTPFISICPHCSSKLRLKNPALIGKKAKCPKCETPFVVSKAKDVNARKSADVKRTAPPKTKKARPKTKPVAQPVPSTDDSPDDDWLNDDLSTFESEELGRPTASAPPRVDRQKKKKKRRRPDGVARKARDPYGPEGGRGWLIVLAIVAGSVAGMFGSALWIGIMFMTGYEIGILAWGVGGLVGFAVLLASGDWVDEITGMIAAVIAFLSVTGPKLALYLLGLIFGAGVGLGEIFGLFDVLWIFLAAGTAFRVGSGQSDE